LCTAASALADGQSFITLQPDERDVEGSREGFGGRGLTDSWFALQKQWSAECDREIQRGGQAVVDEVVQLVEPFLDLRGIAQRVDYGDTSIAVSAASLASRAS
jgi:hypothetical protein